MGFKIGKPFRICEDGIATAMRHSDFAFPVVVNSPLFNPTEPRDGIPLIHSERSGGDSDENRKRIIEAINLYNDMLDYFATKG